MEKFCVNLALSILRLLRLIVYPFYALIYCRRLPSIPSIKNPLLEISASMLAKKIRHGELSSQAIVEAYIQRVKEVNPFINAVVEDRFEAALNDAKICDAMLKSGEVTVSMLEKEKPLYGVPLTVKESCSIKGMSSTGGCKKTKHVKAPKDGGAVELLKNAGAIPLLLSNTSEFCAALNSANFLFGQTRNPYDRRKTPGGSSGGEAALLGAGASVLGVGSDLVGSIRIPAHFNGVFGHKPSPDVIPIEGHNPLGDDATFRQILTVGPLSRYAEDLYLAMKVLSSNSERSLNLDAPVDIKNLRVLYVDNFESFCGIRATTSDIRRTIHKAVDYLSEKGARVEHLSQEWMRNIELCVTSLFGELKVPELLVDPKHPDEKKRPLLEFVKALFGLSSYSVSLTFIRSLIETKAFIPASKREHYRQVRLELRQKVNDVLKDDAIFISPSYPHAACYPQFMFFELDCNIYGAFENLLHLPSTHVPMGLNKDGLPIGLQVTAATYQDHLCLAVAKELEKAFGGWIPPS